VLVAGPVQAIAEQRDAFHRWCRSIERSPDTQHRQSELLQHGAWVVERFRKHSERIDESVRLRGGRIDERTADADRLQLDRFRPHLLA
jgi:hypothetical protein